MWNQIPPEWKAVVAAFWTLVAMTLYAIALPIVGLATGCDPNDAGTALRSDAATGDVDAGCPEPTPHESADVCVECIRDEHCPESRPYCVNRTCGVCAADEHCGGQNECTPRGKCVPGGWGE